MLKGIRSCLLAGLAAIAGASHGAANEPGVLHLGSLELSYDTARWRAQAAGERAFDIEPVGENARKLDDVRVTWKPNEAGSTCEAQVGHMLWSEMYEPPVAVPVEIAGIAAQRFVADTRCRNAMPKGVVVCVPHSDGIYLIGATHAGCGGARNLFSGIDPLDEIVRGAKFTP